jgi:hypothetical protein
LIYNAISIVGAVKMQNLESRAWGIVSSCMFLLPMGVGGISSVLGGVFHYTIGDWIMDERAAGVFPFYSVVLAVLPYLLGILVGVWSLRTLMMKKVIAGFEYVAD